MNALLYIRVSTVDQAIRGGQPEGFSIPAQREACRNKAKNLRATVVDEYVDRGESARSADRPELQRLLTDLASRKDIDYIIVHKLDRLARSLHDDVTIALAIQKAGAKLISVMENIDETPSGQLLHGIMATIAEFYSRNLAAEALKGATQKAKRGGTPFRAPIGYVNIVQYIDGRETRTVAVDEDRAPHIKWLFERYASGEWNGKMLARELARRGFKSRRTGSSVAKVISPSTVYKILHNRYYAGYVTYCGIEYKGRHRAIVNPALFAAVQALLDSARKRNVRRRKHDHYLSATLSCGQCGKTLIFAQAKQRYHYFFCPSRQQGAHCRQPFIPISLIEEAISNNLNRLILNQRQREELRKETRMLLRDELRYAKIETGIQEKRLSKLLSEKDRLLQAYYEDIVTPSTLKREHKRIDKELEDVRELLSESQATVSAVNLRCDHISALVDTLQLKESYLAASPQIRRFFNHALFETIVINDQKPLSHSTYRHDVTIELVRLRQDIDYRKLALAIAGLTYTDTEHVN